MPVQHLPKATNVTIRAQRGSQMAPAPPADGKFYTPAELAAMTNDEQLYLAEHPRFWVVNPDDHQEDFSNDEFADPDSSPSYVGSASGDTHMSDSGTVIADKGKTGTNSLGLGLPARQFTPSVTVGQPPAPLFGTHPPVDVVPSLARLHNASQRQANLEASGGSSFLEKNVGAGLQGLVFQELPSLYWRSISRCQALAHPCFVNRLKRGLKDKVKGIVRAGRIAGRPLTFDQIVVTALEEDKEFRSRITSTYSISQVNNNNTRMASTSNNTNGGGSSKRTRDSSRACFNCGGDNHVSSNCTEPKTAKQLKYEAKRAASSSSKTLNV
ncbi:hypothetical protein Pst134EB_001316 [Puccinia striiformis f. sp. tritici]|nr:hypothetical protein Pst134EB_001316 [Puccinia striiformis f. sp. tritici]